MVDADMAPFEEGMRNDPFKMMVGCVFANRTRWVTAKPVHDEFFQRWSTPEDVYKRAGIGEMEELFRPLGFHTKRAVGVAELAKTWLTRGGPKSYRDVPTYPLLGEYAMDAWRIFIDGDIAFTPCDSRLQHFLERRAPYLETKGEHWWAWPMTTTPR